jgi:hypothetical protein
VVLFRLHALAERRARSLRSSNARLRREVELRRRSEAAQLAAAEEARAANLAKARFLASMSHELRTPLNGVLGMTHALEGTALDDGQRQALATLRSSGELLLGLVGDVLDFARLEAGGLRIREDVEGPSPGEPPGHQSYNVGNPNGEYRSFSFGVHMMGQVAGVNIPEVSFFDGLQGRVYEEEDGLQGGQIVEDSYRETTAEEDEKVIDAIGGMIAQGPSPYRVVNRNCRWFCRGMMSNGDRIGIGTCAPAPERPPQEGAPGGVGLRNCYEITGTFREMPPMFYAWTPRRSG